MTELQGEFTPATSEALTESMNMTSLSESKTVNESKQQVAPQTHPLHNDWQFWYYQRQSPQQYFAQQVPDETSMEKPVDQPAEEEGKPWKGK